ncbi:MAG: hypothetical protein IT483_14540, partial [Gammaproteobacteria bacterium]|nr:hypothetical protein [Gammaproteobacteria bacterium]
MATYVCPLDMQVQMAASAGNPPCHEEAPEAEDRVRCEAHCNPTVPTFDPPHTISAAAAAILPSAAIEFAEPSLIQWHAVAAAQLDIDACAPPLRTRYCSLLI